jgi:hypothetical protein
VDAASRETCAVHAIVVVIVIVALSLQRRRCGTISRSSLVALHSTRLGVGNAGCGGWLGGNPG